MKLKQNILKTLETKGSDNQTVQQNKLVENEENRVEYEHKTTRTE